MIKDLLETIVKNIGFAGFLVSAGLLLLLSAQGLFEVDATPRKDEDPTGGFKEWPEWRYMSDQAQDARSEIVSLANYLKIAVTLLVGIAICSAIVIGTGDLSKYLFTRLLDSGICGTSNCFARFVCSVTNAMVKTATFVRSNEFFPGVVHHAFGATIIAFAPILIFQFGRLVLHVILARQNYRANKK